MDWWVKNEFSEHYWEDLWRAIDKIKVLDQEIWKSLDHYVRWISCVLDLANESEKFLWNSRLKLNPDFARESSLYRYSVLKIIHWLSADKFLIYVEDDIRKHWWDLNRDFWNSFFSKYFN